MLPLSVLYPESNSRAISSEPRTALPLLQTRSVPFSYAACEGAFMIA